MKNFQLIVGAISTVTVIVTVALQLYGAIARANVSR